MHVDNIKLCWEEARRTCYLMDEYGNRTSMELTSGEAVEFQVELLENYGMMSGNSERRGGRYQISYDNMIFYMISDKISGI